MYKFRVIYYYLTASTTELTNCKSAWFYFYFIFTYFIILLFYLFSFYFYFIDDVSRTRRIKTSKSHVDNRRVTSVLEAWSYYLKTTRTQIVRFVSIIDPKVDFATIIKRRAYLSKLALPTINGGRETAIGSAARLLFN